MSLTLQAFSVFAKEAVFEFKNIDLKVRYVFEQGKPDRVEMKYADESHWKIVGTGKLGKIMLSKEEYPKHMPVFYNSIGEKVEILTLDSTFPFVHFELDETHYGVTSSGELLNFGGTFLGKLHWRIQRKFNDGSIIYGMSFRSDKRDSKNELFVLSYKGKMYSISFPIYDQNANDISVNPKQPGYILIKGKKIKIEDLDSHEVSNKKKTTIPPNLLPKENTPPKLESVRVSYKDDKEDAFSIVEDFSSPFQFSSDPENFVSVHPSTGKKISRQLNRGEGKSLAVLGESGSGVLRFLEHSIGEFLKNESKKEKPRPFHFRVLNASMLSAGTRYSGTFSSRISAMLALSERNPHLIWVIKGMDVMRGVGTHSESSNDFFHRIREAMSQGKFRMIGVVTPQAWNHSFLTDPSVASGFQVLNYSSPQRDQIFQILKKRYRKNAFSEEIINAAIELSDQFDSVGNQPKKAIRLMDGFLLELEEEQKETQTVELNDLKLFASEHYTLSMNLFDPDYFVKKLRSLPLFLNQTIIGQKEAKKILIRGAVRSLSETGNSSQPRYRLLFVGDRGLGKTEIARTFANHMGFPFVRLNMAQYSHSVDGRELLHKIAQSVIKNPFTIFLFDEIEKAHIDVQNVLLDLLDEGQFDYKNPKVQNSDPISLNVRHAGFMFATNAGKELSQRSVYDQIREKSEYSRIERAVEDGGLSRFLVDRMSDLAVFSYPSRSEFKKIAALHIEKIIQKYQSNLKGLKIDLKNKTQWIEDLEEKIFRSDLSNRVIVKRVQQEVGDVLSAAVLEAGLKPTVVTLTYSRDRKAFISSGSLMNQLMDLLESDDDEEPSLSGGAGCQNVFSLKKLD
tara:strand:- start:6 stop:2549 length:2544 start_codon:yes stop_codon:yes gene_type:complete